MNNFSAKTTFVLSLFAFCSSLYAETVDLTYTLVGKKPRTETVKLEEVSPDTFRLRIPKASIADDVAYLEIAPEFARADRKSVV